eukprot:6187355-Pleurochrysis_carterae.AAC.1
MRRSSDEARDFVLKRAGKGEKYALGTYLNSSIYEDYLCFYLEARLLIPPKGGQCHLVLRLLYPDELRAPSVVHSSVAVLADDEAARRYDAPLERRRPAAGRR